MIVARYGAIVPTLVLAGALAAKPRNDSTKGTIRTDGVLFASLLVSNVVITDALTFLPADALGSIVEQFDMQAGRVY